MSVMTRAEKDETNLFSAIMNVSQESCATPGNQAEHLAALSLYSTKWRLVT